MKRYDSKTIEEYQIVLLKNPASKVFAPLAEAYRQMGLVQQALEICERGVEKNPDYASGLVAYGKTLIELEQFAAATVQLEKAITLKPDNVLAHRLLCLCYQKLDKPQKALPHFKALLFLKPNDQHAQEFVKKWSFLETQNTTEIEPESILFEEAQAPEDLLTYIDTLGLRSEYDAALDNSSLGESRWPAISGFKERTDWLSHSANTPLEDRIRDVKVEFYQTWLRRAERLRQIISQENDSLHI